VGKNYGAVKSRMQQDQAEPRSQSAVSEPTPLSVPFEAMSSALNQNSVSLSASTGERVMPLAGRVTVIGTGVQVRL
jgi:hypothetical protein